MTVVGGTSAVSETWSELDADVGEVRRLAGATRYATSAVAEEALARGITPAATWIAAGGAFPDALVAGAAAGRRRVLLLVDGTDLAASPETRDWLAAILDEVEVIRLAGGTAALSAAVEVGLSGLSGR